MDIYRGFEKCKEEFPSKEKFYSSKTYSDEEYELRSNA